MAAAPHCRQRSSQHLTPPRLFHSPSHAGDVPIRKDPLVVDGRIGRRRFPRVGTTLDGTELTGLTLNLGLNFANPAIGLLAKSFALGLYSTPNTGSADENADYGYLPSLQSINNFLVDGQAYQFELRGFDNVRGDGHLNSSASEFHVREGQSATADVFGVLSAVPEPGTWAMMLIGFAMIGVAMRSRRRDMPAALV